jgi:DNA polymerase III subunit delta'
MPLLSLRGHAEVRRLLGRALQAGSLPQSILIHGPAGVGKERLGLWLAQLLLCEEQAAEPCGLCRSCRLADRLEHPDIHWFFPLPRPDASSAEKLREKLEDARAAEMQLRRTNPLHEPEFDKAPAHFLASVRSLQRFAMARPNTGDRKVFVIGDAELMVPQESSPEAANAFLKLLEEPPASATLILTSSQPGALLPTILSRVNALRVGLVSEQEVQLLLGEAGLANAEKATTLARRAAGSTRRALRLLAAGGAGEDADRKAGRELLLAALATGSAARLGAAHERRPAGARNDLIGQLDALSEWLRDLLAVVASAPDRVTDAACVPILTRAVEQRGVRPEGVMEGIQRVAAARDLAAGNVNPQLIIADLLRNLQRDLAPASAPGGDR